MKKTQEKFIEERKNIYVAITVDHQRGSTEFYIKNKNRTSSLTLESRKEVIELIELLQTVLDGTKE